MPSLGEQLDLERCPHCNVDHPTLHKMSEFNTTDYRGHNSRFWRVYKCSGCGGLVTASASGWGLHVNETYPESQEIDDSLPSLIKEYLRQTRNSLHSPAGAVMLAASAVDSMLKAKDYKEGSLYSRIDKAAEDHIITSDMAKWAHEVRLDANDQRHADESVSLPSTEDARRSLNFAMALAQFMFILPARVQQGITESSTSSTETGQH